MHLAQRAYVLLTLTAVLAVTGLWSSDPALSDLWRIPAVLLLLGLAYEGLFVRGASVTADIETAPRAFLGREQTAACVFRNESSRKASVEYALVMPAGVEPVDTTPRKVVAPAGGERRDAFTLLPVSLGLQMWPAIPA